MSGILGVWNATGAAVPRGVFDRMSAKLAHRGQDGEGRWESDGAVLSCQLLRVTPESLHERQPIAHGDLAIVLDGRIDNRDELVDLLSGDFAVSKDSPDAELVLAGYEKWAEAVSERLNGDFAFAVFDGKRKKLVLSRDPLGIRSLYYSRTRDGIAFATEIKALLEHPEIPTRLNEQGFAVYIVTGCPWDKAGETPFAGVFTVQPGFTVSFSADGTRKTARYFDFDCSKPTSIRSFDEACDGLRHYLQQAVRRRIRSAYPISMWVSGGLDSSSLFCLSERLRKSEPGLCPAVVMQSIGTRDGKMSDEREYLHAIEEQYGAKPLWQELALGRFTPYIADMNRCSEYPSLTPSWELLSKVFKAGRRQGARLLITGEWGDDLLCDRTYLVDFLVRFRWRTLKRHLSGVRQWNTEADPKQFERLFINDVKKHLVPAGLRRLVRGLRGTGEHELFSQHLSVLAQQGFAPYRPPRQPYNRHTARIYESVRAIVGSLEWYAKLSGAYGMDCAFPFLDRDLVAFLLRVPGEVMNRAGVPRAMLREGMADILPLKIRERNNKGDPLQAYRNAFAEEDSRVREMLGPDAMIYEKYVHGKWGALIAAAPAPPDDAMRSRMQQLLRAEGWLQTFFNCTPPENAGNIAGVEAIVDAEP